MSAPFFRLFLSVFVVKGAINSVSLYNLFCSQFQQRFSWLGSLDGHLRPYANDRQETEQGEALSADIGTNGKIITSIPDDHGRQSH
jgi:hypothetical protein